jgi:hypothetical protein
VRIIPAPAPRWTVLAHARHLLAARPGERSTLLAAAAEKARRIGASTALREIEAVHQAALALLAAIDAMHFTTWEALRAGLGNFLTDGTRLHSPQLAQLVAACRWPDLSDVPQHAGKGRRRNDEAQALAVACAQVFAHITGARAAIRTNLAGDTGGPFHDFAAAVFAAFAVKGDPLHYARGAVAWCRRNPGAEKDTKPNPPG